MLMEIKRKHKHRIMISKIIQAEKFSIKMAALLIVKIMILNPKMTIS